MIYEYCLIHTKVFFTLPQSTMIVITEHIHHTSEATVNINFPNYRSTWCFTEGTETISFTKDDAKDS